MLLLTWHGTILRVEQSKNRLIHAPLVPVRSVARDLSFTDALPGGLQLHPGPHPGAAHITRDNTILRALPDEPYPIFSTEPPTPDDCVLPITEAEAAALRALLTTPHRHQETGEHLPPARLRPGFILSAGDGNDLNLAEGRPTLTETGIILPAGAGTLLSSAAAPDAADIALVATAPTATITLRGAPELHFLPLTASFATRDWFYTSAETPLTGSHNVAATIHRADAAFLLTLGTGRTIFTRQGAMHAPPPPATPPPYPAGLAREADTFFVAQAALDEAATLPGPHALLPTAADRPILESVLPFILMAPHLPPHTTLLHPAPDAALLALFGLSPPTAPAPAPLCAIETLFWPGAAIGADTARAARAMAHAVHAPPETRRRLFITEGLGNADHLAEIAAVLDFEIMSSVPATPSDRASLFAGVSVVIAASGNLLEYLLFCLPGTQVVELAPDTVWNQRYARLSNQLDLVHAALPCPVGHGGLQPDTAAFRRLLRILRARL